MLHKKQQIFGMLWFRDMWQESYSKTLEKIIKRYNLIIRDEYFFFSNKNGLIFVKNEIIIEVSSIFQRIPTQENIVCITDCECWKFDFETFQELFHKIPNLREWGRAWMSHQLFVYKQRSVEMFTLSATKRYLNLLEQKPHVIQFAPLKQIASYLGVTDTSLSRIRKELVSHPKKI